MVDQELVNYISEGKKRGFSVNLLKKKLMEEGYSQNEVDEAEKGAEDENVQKPIQIAEKINEPPIRKGKVPTKSLPFMKVGGWAGAILLMLLLALAIFGIGFSQTANGLLSNKIIFVDSMIVLAGLGFFYYLGFVKTGKSAGNRKINVGSWLVIICILVFLVISVISNFLSLSVEVKFPIVAISFLTVALVGLAGQFIFSWGITKIIGQIKFAKISGIFNWITLFVMAIFFVSSAFLSYEVIVVISNYALKSADFGFDDILSQVSNFSRNFLLISFIGFYFTLIFKIVFDVLVLLNSSKKFEN